jgi:hypothetical protein
MLKLYHVFLSWGIYKGAAVYLLDSPYVGYDSYGFYAGLIPSQTIHSEVIFKRPIGAGY